MTDAPGHPPQPEGATPPTAPATAATSKVSVTSDAIAGFLTIVGAIVAAIGMVAAVALMTTVTEDPGFRDVGYDTVTKWTAPLQGLAVMTFGLLLVGVGRLLTHAARRSGG